MNAASAWEVTTKHRLGALPMAGPLAVDFDREVRRQGFTARPISMVHDQVAEALPGIQRDPFDRVLVAQAREERIALVSDETVFDEYGVSRYW